jgi:hypothetical protein
MTELNVSLTIPFFSLVALWSVDCAMPFLIGVESHQSFGKTQSKRMAGMLTDLPLKWNRIHCFANGIMFLCEKRKDAIFGNAYR